MKNLFVNINTAVGLKMLNFNKPCIKYLNISTKLESEVIPFDAKNWNDIENMISIPLYQQAFEFLYELTGEWIIPIPNDDKPGEWFGCGKSYESYEKARLACVEVLINKGLEKTKTYTLSQSEQS